MALVQSRVMGGEVWRISMMFKALQQPFLKLLGAGFFPQLLLLALAPLLTRLFSPENFGIYGLFVALAATIAALSGGRLEFAILSANSAREAGALLLTALVVAAPIGLLLTGGLVAIARSGFSAHLGPVIALNTYLLWLPLAALSIVVFQVLHYWALWQKNYVTVSYSRWVQGISVGGLQLVAGLSALGAMGLIFSHTLSQALGAAIVLLRSWRYLCTSLRGLCLQECIRLLYSNRRYPLLMTPATLFNMLAQHMPVFLTGAMYGIGAAGFLAIAQRICGAPLALVASAIGQVYSAEAPKLITSAPGKLAAAFKTLLRNMFLLGAVLLALIVTFAPVAVSSAFGNEWHDAGVLMQIMAVVYVLDFVTTPFSLTLAFTKNYVEQLYWDIARVALIVMAFGIGNIYDFSFFETAALLSVALACSSLWHLWLMWRGLKTSPGGA